jgi:hypothetical protein
LQQRFTGIAGVQPIEHGAEAGTAADRTADAVGDTAEQQSDHRAGDHHAQQRHPVQPPRQRQH